MIPSKKKILDKAFELFLTRSFDSVSMREIQEESQLSRGAIYHHFKSKEEIFEQVVDMYLLPVFSSYSMIPDEEKRTLQEAIYSTAKYQQNHMILLNDLTKSMNVKMTDFFFFKFLFQATEHCKDFKEKAALIYEKEYNGWRNVIQSALRNGEVRADIEIDFVAQQFIISPYGLGICSAFSQYVHTGVSDTRTLHLKLYNLIRKTVGFR